MFAWVCVSDCLCVRAFLLPFARVCVRVRARADLHVIVCIVSMSKEWFMYFHCNDTWVIVVRWRHVYAILSPVDGDGIQGGAIFLLLKSPHWWAEISSKVTGPFGRNRTTLACCQRPAVTLRVCGILLWKNLQGFSVLSVATQPNDQGY